MLGPVPCTFFDLHECSPIPPTIDILERVGMLYTVDAAVGGQLDERRRARQDRTRPRVDALHEELDVALRRLSHESDMARAIVYGRKR